LQLHLIKFLEQVGGAIAQADFRWLPTAAAWVRAPNHSTDCSTLIIIQHPGLVQ
jgi:hypothetical protein